MSINTEVTPHCKEAWATVNVKHPTSLCVVAGVRELCYTGSFREFTSHVLIRKDDYHTFPIKIRRTTLI